MDTISTEIKYFVSIWLFQRTFGIYLISEFFEKKKHFFWTFPKNTTLFPYSFALFPANVQVAQRDSLFQLGKSLYELIADFPAENKCLPV